MARATREPAPPGPSLWRVRLATVGSRVILAVIGLTALALTIAGLTAYSLERALTEGVQRRQVLARRHADRARQRGTPR